MRIYYIISGIHLILSIIDFAVAAPVLVQKKPQARVAMTILGKRGGELDELWVNLFGHPEGHSLPQPEALPAAHLPSSSQSSGALGPAGGQTNVERPPPSIDEEPLPLSSKDHLPPSLSEEWNKMWRDLIELHFPSKPDTSSPARPSSSSHPLGPAGGQTDVAQPMSSINEEPLPLSSKNHLPPSLGEEWNKMWRDLIETHFPSEPDKSSPARPSLSSHPLGPAGGQTNVEQPMSSIDEEPLPVSSPDHLLPSPGDDLNDLWLDLYGHQFFEESSAAHPSRPAHGWMDVEQPLQSIPGEPLPVSSPHHAPPSPGSSTESWHGLIDWDGPHWPSGPASPTMSPVDHDMMDVPRSITASSTNHDF